MHRTAALLALAVVTGAVAAPVPKALKKSDAETFAGKWEVVCEENGQPSSTGTWTFDAELKMKVASPNQPGAEYRVILDPAQSPKQIDVGDFKGIYAIDGDDIRIAFTTRGDRPASFDPKPGVFDNRLRRATDKGK